MQLGHVSEKTDSFALGIMVVEMLGSIGPVDARAFVSNYEVDTLPAALKDLAEQVGWPAATASILSKVATSCTRGAKTRTTPAQALIQMESAWDRRSSSGSWLFG